MSQKVLVVDDDPDVRLFSVTVLEENGYTPLEAEDGESGGRVPPDSAGSDMAPVSIDRVQVHCAERTLGRKLDWPLSWSRISRARHATRRAYTGCTPAQKMRASRAHTPAGSMSRVAIVR